jgi:hypothetical protein
MTLFVARQARYGQLRGRRRGTSRCVVTSLRGGLGHAENEADGRRSAAAVEDDSWMGSLGWKG